MILSVTVSTPMQSHPVACIGTETGRCANRHSSKLTTRKPQLAHAIGAMVTRVDLLTSAPTAYTSTCLPRHRCPICRHRLSGAVYAHCSQGNASVFGRVMLTRPSGFSCHAYPADTSACTYQKQRRRHTVQGAGCCPRINT
jgi:hypothetical protein